MLKMIFIYICHKNNLLYIYRRNGEAAGSFFENLNLNKILGMINAASSVDAAAQEKTSSVVDETLKRTMEVAFNFFEFVTSHKSLVDGASRRADGESFASKTAFDENGLPAFISKDTVDLVS
jgi:hypothetical protein